MKDKVKKALKRVASGLMAAIFALCFVGIPRVKAVAVVDDVAVGAMSCEAFLASIGLPLTATGGSSAVTAGVTAIAGEYAVATGAAASGEAFLGTVAAGTAISTAGAIVLTATAAVAVGALAYWAYNKYFVDSHSNSIVVYSAGNTGKPAKLADGTSLQGYNCQFGVIYTLENGFTFLLAKDAEGGLSIILNGSVVGTVRPSISSSFAYYGFATAGFVNYYYSDGSYQYSDTLTTYNRDMWYVLESTLSLTNNDYTPIPEIAPSKQLELHVGASAGTTLEDLVQSIPEQVANNTLNVTYTIVSSDGGVPEVNPNPDVDAPEDIAPYTVGLGEVFPFCIPFDVYHMVTMFAANPEAPAATWEFTLPWSGQECAVSWSLEEWDEVAKLCRSLELVLFCVGLAVATYKTIKW